VRTTILVLTAVILASGCSTKQIHVSPDSDLRSINSYLQLEINRGDVDLDVVDDLTRYLKAKLIIAGFDIESTDADRIQLYVDIQRFSAGDAGVRMAVGFGAGRGSLLYLARYTAPDGRVLAEMNGAEHFTGTEPHFNMKYGSFANMGGAERVQSVLVQEAAEHIVELALAGN
jgi:hypothetical protein